MADIYDSMPKVELHCHVEGTIRPATVAELAKKAGRTLPVAEVTELYRYGSLDEFLSIFWFVQELLMEPGDWERAAYESLIDAVPHGLRYREMFFTPARHMAGGQDLEGIIDGLSAGIEAAEAEARVRCWLIADMDRSFGGSVGLELVEKVGELRRSGRAERVIGIGMDSTELGVDPRDFVRAFELAARLGLRRTSHAGEDTGPDNIAAAVDVLKVERIDHGLSILGDPELVRRVAGARIPLDVCPNSNVLIANKVARLEEHPFRRMRQEGLLATLNTDDPAMTDLDLGREYRSVAAALEMDHQEMAAVALDGVEATWLDESEKRGMRSQFEVELQTLLEPSANT
ncbi:MAG: adenosine deaminase [Actinomycetota bacterium]